ncbi:unnamed protein product [Candida verbasci]|uniref:Uncharacterized protein n=1 Tax=Candida verbasci TaxID=1227364 RepID=A0A9W4TVV6_9ASCO|nr:unnamed protein product [Candida verbasci]
MDKEQEESTSSNQDNNNEQNDGLPQADEKQLEEMRNFGDQEHSVNEHSNTDSLIHLPQEETKQQANDQDQNDVDMYYIDDAIPAIPAIPEETAAKINENNQNKQPLDKQQQEEQDQQNQEDQESIHEQEGIQQKQKHEQEEKLKEENQQKQNDDENNDNEEGEESDQNNQEDDNSKKPIEDNNTDKDIVKKEDEDEDEEMRSSDSDDGEVKPPKPRVSLPSKQPQPDESDDNSSDEEVISEKDDDEDKVKQKPTYKQTHLIVVPSYASWFNMKKIHNIEKQSLPEFFSTNHPSKSPKIYVNYRNFMINSYRLNPNEFLTLTSCRRNLVGDVGVLMRVHRFLMKWGLINYQVKPQFKPGYAVEKLPNGQSVDLPYTGDYHVKYDTPRGLFPFETAPKINIDTSKINELLENGEIKKRKSEIKEEPNKKQKIDDNWTSEESNSLIKAVKEFKNDWYKIASKVGNKTPEECVLKFLQIPLEEEFDPIKENTLLKYASNYPISSLDNPVLSNLIFLTKLVDSDVVKAASDAAKKAVDDYIKNKVGHHDKPTDAKEGEGEDNSQASEQKDSIQSQNGSMKEIEPTSKNAIATTLGVIGGRSHLFSSYEEREMHKIGSSIINHELNKIETKLKKVEELEKIYERERQNITKQQEECFIDRLTLTRSTISVIKTLDKAINILESSNFENNNNHEQVKNLLSDAKQMLFKPSRQVLEECNTNPSSDEKTKTESNSNEDDLKPLSMTQPQTFKVWAL